MQHGDARGQFAEWYKETVFTEAVGHPLHVAQSNLSVSAKGTLRGIHFAQLPPSQAKYVFCPRARSSTSSSTCAPAPRRTGSTRWSGSTTSTARRSTSPRAWATASTR